MWLLTVFPVGLIVGGVTERLACRQVLPKSLPAPHCHMYNTFIHVVAAYLAWTILILPYSDEYCCKGFSVYDIRLGIRFILHSILRRLLHLNSDAQLFHSFPSYCTCSSQSEFIFFLVIFILKCLLFCALVQLGITLQPVGVTGGIACGKSTVSKIFRELICHEDSVLFIDIDAIAHEILQPSNSDKGSVGRRHDTAYWKIIDAFSQDDILQDPPSSENNASLRKIDRTKLGGIIFQDATKRRKLNSITHPLISKIMIRKIIHASFHLFRRNAPFVIVDIPLLFEAGLKMKLLFGVKVVVATPYYLQLHRLMKRNPELSQQQCEERIGSQMPVTKKSKMADIVIWNNQNLSYLEERVEKVFAEIMNRKRGYFGLSMIHFILLSLAVHVGVMLREFQRYRK